MNPVLNNLRYLHIIRGLAALIVVIFHAKFVLWVGGAIYKDSKGLNSIGDYLLFGIDMLSSCGEQCVIMFFILSAFVIRHTFDKYKNDLLSFYKLRLLRIYLPLLFSIAFGILILYVSINFINPSIYGTDFRNYNERLTNAYDQLSFSQILQTVFLVEQNEYAGANYAYWSLGHELVFYILCPFYFKLSRLLKFGLIAVFLFLYIISDWNVFYLQSFFIAGLILYDYFKIYSVRPVLSNKWLNLLIIAFFYISINISVKLFPDWIADVLTLIFCLFLFDYMFYFLNKPSRIFMKLGDISYSLYLNHLPLLLLFYSAITLFTGQLVFYSRIPYYTGVIFALICSFPLYYLAEKPSINLLKRIRR